MCAGAENTVIAEVHQRGDDTVWRYDSGITDSCEKHRDEFYSKFGLRVASGENQCCVPDRFRHAYSSLTEKVSQRKIRLIHWQDFISNSIIHTNIFTYSEH